MTKMQDDAASGDQSLAQCWNVGPSNQLWVQRVLEWAASLHEPSSAISSVLTADN